MGPTISLASRLNTAEQPGHLLPSLIGGFEARCLAVVLLVSHLPSATGSNPHTPPTLKGLMNWIPKAQQSSIFLSESLNWSSPKLESPGTQGVRWLVPAFMSCIHPNCCTVDGGITPKLGILPSKGLQDA